MKQRQLGLPLTICALLIASACVRPYYLSQETRDKTNESLDYRIERTIISAKVDADTSVIQAWLEIRNYTPEKTTLTIDCRFYDRDFSPNEPITNKVRTITMEPWQVRVEPFSAMSLPPYDISAWCGIVNSELVSTTHTNRQK